MKNGKITFFEGITIFEYDFNNFNRFQTELHACQLASVSGRNVEDDDHEDDGNDEKLIRLAGGDQSTSTYKHRGRNIKKC